MNPERWLQRVLGQVRGILTRAVLDLPQQPLDPIVTPKFPTAEQEQWNTEEPVPSSLEHAFLDSSMKVPVMRRGDDRGRRQTGSLGSPSQRCISAHILASAEAGGKKRR